jgi:hypothetical protein
MCPVLTSDEIDVARRIAVIYQELALLKVDIARLLKTKLL